MKIAALAVSATCLFAASAQAECRRVTTPTVLAIVAHGTVWTKPVELGKTLRVSACGIRIYDNVYCQIDSEAKPPVYVLDGDRSGKEYTAFWGKVCR